MPVLNAKIVNVTSGPGYGKNIFEADCDGEPTEREVAEAQYKAGYHPQATVALGPLRRKMGKCDGRAAGRVTDNINRIVEGREVFYLVRELLKRNLIRYVSSGHGMRITDAGREYLHENGNQS